MEKTLGFLCLWETAEMLVFVGEKWFLFVDLGLLN